MGGGAPGEDTAEMWDQKGFRYPSQPEWCPLSSPSPFSLSPPHPQRLSEAED